MCVFESVCESVCVRVWCVSVNVGSVCVYECALCVLHRVAPPPPPPPPPLPPKTDRASHRSPGGAKIVNLLSFTV